MSQKAHWSGSSADLTFACEKNGKRLANSLHRSCDAHRFTVLAELNPKLYCIPCARAARLALAKESAPKPEPPKSTGPLRCSTKGCGSYAVNPEHHGRTYGVDLDLCDVCYWRKRAQPEPRPISEARETEILGYCPDIGWRRLSRIGSKWGLTGAEHIADYEPTHFLPLPPSPEVK
jgi:hypothetical protein